MCAPEEKFKMHGKRKGKFSHFLQFQSSFWARRLKKCNQFNASVIIILNSPQYQNKMAKKSNRSVFLKLGEKLYWFKIFYLDFLAKPDQYWLCFWHFKVRILLLFCWSPPIHIERVLLLLFFFYNIFRSTFQSGCVSSSLWSQRSLVSWVTRFCLCCRDCNC